MYIISMYLCVYIYIVLFILTFTVYIYIYISEAYIYIHIYIYTYIYIHRNASKARKCFTFCASVWGDGTAGPVAFSMPSGGISGALRVEINDKYPGEVYIIVNNGPTHMMNSESILELYERLYSPAFKVKRHQLGLTHAHTGMLVCDGFTGAHSSSEGWDERRLRFSEAENIVLPPNMPGGWSAKGQPADQIFSHYKSRVRDAMDVVLGFGSTFFDRSKYHELPIGPTGTRRGLFLKVIGGCYIGKRYKAHVC